MINFILIFVTVVLGFIFLYIFLAFKFGYGENFFQKITNSFAWWDLFFFLIPYMQFKKIKKMYEEKKSINSRLKTIDDLLPPNTHLPS